LLAPAKPPAGAGMQKVELIRQAMLASLGGPGASRKPRLATRIRYCREAETLWLLRCELMDANCELYGESRARAQLARITALFVGVLPYAGAGESVRRPSARPRPH
jgi:hypothetical protein